MKYSIYYLIDCITNRIFYVGMTSLSLKNRFCIHKRDAKNINSYNHLNKEILLSRKCDIVEIQKCSSRSIAVKKENLWIKKFTQQGIVLNNKLTTGEYCRIKLIK